MDFATLPPEVTSGQMYAGPGDESLLAAAAAWNGLAAELHTAASSYGATIAELTASWQGPSSAAMAAAAAPYVQWLTATATQAADLSTRATAAAGAYADAFAATVPPPIIAANRSELATLTATNLLGQNTAAIAAVEAQYTQMWLQNAATMYGYAAASAMAAPQAAFGTPPDTTDPTRSIAGTAQAAAAPVQAAAGAPAAGLVQQLYEDLFLAVASVGKMSTFSNVSMSAPNLGMVQFKTFYKAPITIVDIPKSALGAALREGPRAATAAAGLARVASAEAGAADLVGRLSVPPSWASTAPAIRLAVAALPETAVAGGLPSTLPAMALGNVAGGVAGTALSGAAPRVLNATVVRGGGAVRTGKTPVKLDKVIAQLQQQPGSVRHWNVDEAGFDDLITELSKKPGVHTVHLAADTSGAPPTSMPPSGDPVL